MTKYKLTLFFTNLDNFMGTDETASMTVDITADDSRHALLLAQRFQKVMDADHITLSLVDPS
jgi:acetolactate synthase regulatory subunit